MSKKRNQSKKPKVIEEELNTIFSAEFLEKTAKETDFILRNRIINPLVMFWTLTLGFGVQHERSFASLQRLYEDKAKVHLSRSSFYERFTPKLVKFIHACVLHGMENIMQTPNIKLKDKLANFKDLITQDSTIIRLNKKLADKWPAARTKKVAAGVKVSLLISAVADGPKRIALYGERISEVKTLRIGQWVKDRILLIDLGFYKHNTFARIDENGGFFISRLKNGVNPLIIKTNSVCRGHSIDIEGKRLNEVLSKLERQVVDVEVDIVFKRRKYNGKQSKDVKRFRLIAIYNVEDKKYHAYITNIPADWLDAEDVAVLYSARWEIELIFKELKSRYGIDIIRTSNPHAVEALLWVGILTLIVSRSVYLLVYSANIEKAPRYTHLRWATIFAEKSLELLDDILDYAGIDTEPMDLFELFQSQALDPNVNRKRLMDIWRA
jgi:putative transposase